MTAAAAAAACLALRLPDLAALTILALVQGLTEFLPVSSSGHLVLAQAAMGIDGSGFGADPLVVDVALHVGTLGAVLAVYRHDVAALAGDAARLRLGELARLAVGTVPAAAVGLLLGERVEAAFASVRVAAVGLLVTAALLAAGEHARRRAERSGAEGRAIGWKAALWIGAFQAAAVLPGVSRSGATIAAGLLAGVAPAAAARFSFLLAIPAIAGAALFQVPDVAARPLGSEDAATLAWATVLAGFVGWGALRALLAFLGRGAFAWFAVYCALLGAGVLALS